MRSIHTQVQFTLSAPNKTPYLLCLQQPRTLSYSDSLLSAKVDRCNEAVFSRWNGRHPTIGQGRINYHVLRTLQVQV